MSEGQGTRKVDGQSSSTSRSNDFKRNDWINRFDVLERHDFDISKQKRKELRDYYLYDQETRNVRNVEFGCSSKKENLKFVVGTGNTYNKLFTSPQKISLNYGTRTRLEFFEGSFAKKRRKVKCSGFRECKRNYITRAQSELHSSAITVHEIPARHNAQWKTLERDCEKSTLSTPFSTLISQCQAQVPAWRA